MIDQHLGSVVLHRLPDAARRWSMRRRSNRSTARPGRSSAPTPTRSGRTKLIWDGGGEDTISAAHAKAKAHIDLNDGTWSWIGRKAASVLDAGQSWLGHFTQIERAVGSRHADTIIGNELDNTIIGGRGNDVITGGDGADVMTGGPGRDRFVYRSFAEMGSLEHPDTIVDSRGARPHRPARLARDVSRHGDGRRDAARRREAGAVLCGRGAGRVAVRC